MKTLTIIPLFFFLLSCAGKHTQIAVNPNPDPNQAQQTQSVQPKPPDPVPLPQPEPPSAPPKTKDQYLLEAKEALAQGKNLWQSKIATSQPEAIEKLEESLKCFRQAEDASGEAETLALMGEIHLFRQQYEAALSYFAQAAAILEKLQQPDKEAIIWNRVGDAYCGLGNLEKARESFRFAISLLQNRDENRLDIAKILAKIAHIEKDLGNLKEALVQIESVLHTFDSLLSENRQSDLATIYFSSKKNYYDFYVDLLVELHHRYPKSDFLISAFKASERVRTQSLLDVLAKAQIDLLRGVDPKLLEEERNLRAELQRLEAAGKNIERLITKYQNIREKLEAQNPKILTFLLPDLFDPAQIQENIPDYDTLILGYTLGEKRSFLWQVTRTSIECFDLPDRATIEKAVEHVLGLITVRKEKHSQESDAAFEDRIKQADLAYPREAALLSLMLLGPVTKPLQEAKRLIIVADGILQYFPFSALPKPEAGTLPVSRPPLIVDLEVIHLPLISYLSYPSQEKRASSAQRKRIAVFTNQKVPFADLEGEKIRSLVGASQTQIVQNFLDQKALLQSQSLKPFQIIHFATTGIFDPASPEQSRIILAQAHQANEHLVLGLSDIFKLNLQADLVCLSASQATLQPEMRREGLIGLTHGLIYVGADSVLASLWPVHDEARTVFIQRFYEKIFQKKMLPSEALHQVQREMWKGVLREEGVLQKRSWQPPYFWATFVWYGLKFFKIEQI